MKCEIKQIDKLKNSFVDNFIQAGDELLSTEITEKDNAIILYYTLNDHKKGEYNLKIVIRKSNNRVEVESSNSKKLKDFFYYYLEAKSSSESYILINRIIDKLKYFKFTNQCVVHEKQKIKTDERHHSKTDIQNYLKSSVLAEIKINKRIYSSLDKSLNIISAMGFIFKDNKIVSYNEIRFKINNKTFPFKNNLNRNNLEETNFYNEMLFNDIDTYIKYLLTRKIVKISNYSDGEIMGMPNEELLEYIKMIEIVSY